MAELVFSLMTSDVPNATIEALMLEFRARTGTQVQLQPLSWDMAWNEMVKIAIYHNGPDVSEIGATWMSDLAGM
ncbi:MAG TPA: hypothetical protein PKY49_12005, partial [Anaerolineae bacterium]|nr:hypothetical protein [Anaerolineae bacterium]